MEKKALLIFAKNPIHGKVKTRLSKDLGDIQTLRYYQIFLKMIFNITKNLPFDKIVYWDERFPEINPFNNSSFRQEVQSKGDLGRRMSIAFEKELQVYSSVCIIGTDCIELTESLLLDAFSYLDNNDFVIGPAFDGGYYLLGIKSYLADLFEAIPWSTDRVFLKTLERIKETGKTLKILPTLQDVDTIQDLEAMIQKGFIL